MWLAHFLLQHYSTQACGSSGVGSDVLASLVLAPGAPKVGKVGCFFVIFRVFPENDQLNACG